MGEPQPRGGARHVQLDYTFDRLRASKLAQAYALLVPARARPVDTQERNGRMQMAAMYARVSSDQQREAHTIASQTAALIARAPTLELEVPEAWVFEDEGYSGATLERPGLERVRDLAAAGHPQWAAEAALYILCKLKES